MLDLKEITAVEELMRRYVRVLDNRDIEGWVNCFAAEASYTVVPRSNLEQGLPLCIISDESKDRIRDRVVFIRKIWKGNFTDYTTRHLSMLADLRAGDGEGEIEARSNVSIFASEPDGESKILAVGEYIDVIVAFENGCFFKRRQVVLDTEVLPRHIVYPL